MELPCMNFFYHLPRYWLRVVHLTKVNVQDDPTVAASYGVPHISEQHTNFGVNLFAYSTCNKCGYETYNAPVIRVLTS